jgi:hypothetical protein
MDWDIFIRIITLLIGVIGAGKLLYDLSITKRSRMRDEYNFAKNFLDEVNLNPGLHPFLREKGYQAIAGDTRMTGSEIEYLLSLEGPDRALRDYVLGRAYLEHFPQTGNLQIEFKKKYEKRRARQLRIYLYFGIYVALAFCGFSPLILTGIFSMSFTQTILSLTLSIIVCAPYAWLALMAAVRIHRAQMLVEHQHKHTKRIVVLG